MELNPNLTLAEKKVIVGYFVNLYNQAVAREELRKINRHSYLGDIENDKTLIYLMDHALTHVSRETQLIIRHDYIFKSSENWYLEYFSKTSYYRYRLQAIDEFINCLNI